MRMRLILTVLLIVGLVRVHAQDTPAAQTEPRFEAASIRATDLTAMKVGAGGAVPALGVRIVPNGINATLATVEMLMLSAYGIRNYQLLGGPDWIRSDRFDITARAAGQVTPQVAREMMKNLLRDRFNLRARTETREVDVYAVVLANSDGRLGPNLKRTSAECEATLEARKKGAPSTPQGPPDFSTIATKTTCGMSMFSGGASGTTVASMGGVTIDRLVSQISSEMLGPAIDRTGLTGLFDILFSYMSQRGQLQAAAPDLTKDVAPPAFRDALQEQLGLRIQQEKGPLEVVVIDSIERPSDN